MSTLHQLTKAADAYKKSERMRAEFNDALADLNGSPFLFSVHPHYENPRITVWIPFTNDSHAEFEISLETGQLSLITEGDYAADIPVMNAIIEKWLSRDSALTESTTRKRTPPGQPSPH